MEILTRLTSSPPAPGRDEPGRNEGSDYVTADPCSPPSGHPEDHIVGSSATRTKASARSPTGAFGPTAVPTKSPPRSRPQLTRRGLSGPVRPIGPGHEHDLPPIRIAVGHAPIRLPVGVLRRGLNAGGCHPCDQTIPGRRVGQVEHQHVYAIDRDSRLSRPDDL